MKKVIFIISLLISTNSFSQSSDSLEVARLSEEIQIVKQENKDLSLKIEVFNEANNKIIKATYALLALIIGIGIWNAIQSYRINNQKLRSIEENILKKVESQNKEMLRKLSLENQSILNSHINSSKREVLENKILLAKMSCQSIQPRIYRDINVEGFSLNRLLELSIQYLKISGDTKELKEALNHTINYFKKYPDTIEREEYEVDLIRNTVKSITNDNFSDLKELILDLTKKR